MEYINDTGLPSVTNILKTWIDTRWFTKEAMERGNFVHEKVRCYLQFDMMVGFPEEYQPYFDTFLKFADRIKEIILVEERLQDKNLGFCGQPDLVFRDIEGSIVLSDWKTAIAVQKYWPLQLGGYSILLKKQKNIVVDKIMSVRLRSESRKDPLVNTFSVMNSERMFYNQLELFKYFT